MNIQVVSAAAKLIQIMFDDFLAWQAENFKKNCKGTVIFRSYNKKHDEKITNTIKFQN